MAELKRPRMTPGAVFFCGVLLAVGQLRCERNERARHAGVGQEDHRCLV